jgi:hypothetical protein
VHVAAMHNEIMCPIQFEHALEWNRVSNLPRFPIAAEFLERPQPDSHHRIFQPDVAHYAHHIGAQLDPDSDT